MSIALEPGKIEFKVIVTATNDQLAASWHVTLLSKATGEHSWTERMVRVATSDSEAAEIARKLREEYVLSPELH